MSDVAGAPDPGAAPAPAMETVGEAASIRLDALRNDPAFGARRLAKDAAAVNEHRTLMEIVHGSGDDAAKAVLANSIKLEPRPTLAAAERARATAAEAAADLRPNYGEFGRNLGAEGLAATHADLAGWATSLGLPAPTAKSILQHIADEGSKLAGMSPADQAAWRQRQDDVLLGVAHGDKAKVAAWRAAANKTLAAGKFGLSLDKAGTLNSAYVIRTLVLYAK